MIQMLCAQVKVGEFLFVFFFLYTSAVHIVSIEFN